VRLASKLTGWDIDIMTRAELERSVEADDRVGGDTGGGDGNGGGNAAGSDGEPADDATSTAAGTDAAGAAPVSEPN